jgi:putative flippase GtrA
LVRFLIANSIGFVPNLGTYSALVHFVPFCRIYPVVAVAAGAICGMFVNFFLSRRLVFAEPKPRVEMRVPLLPDPPRDVP